MSTTIADRFEVLSELSDNSLRARDKTTGAMVLLTAFGLDGSDWSTPAEFEHAAASLLELDHPAIQTCTAAFCSDGTAYLAHELIDGPTLAQLLDDGKRWTDTEAVRDAQKVLGALGYLHSRDPKIAHQLVSPERLQRRPDGEVVLVGLGPGTTGAQPDLCQRDLQALGRTIQQLLSGGDDDVAPALADVLRQLTNPGALGVYTSAEQVSADLDALAEKTAPLKPPPESTQPARPKPVEDLASTAPLAAPKPVAPADLTATAPLAAPKPVVATLASPAPVEEPDGKPALYYQRTKNFPKWCTVEPTAHGEFAIEFEVRDVEERRLEISIIDKLERLELRTFVNREKREKARRRRVLLVLTVGAVVSVGTSFVYPPLLPLIIMATIAGVAFLMLKNDQVDEPPALELTITPDELTIVRNEEFRLRASPRSARWYLQRNTELMMATDREVTVLELSREARIASDWFWTYLSARCQEIGSRGSSSQGSDDNDPTITREAAVRPLLAQK